MNVSLTRVLLYVQDVRNLAAFYAGAFGLRVVEEIEGEWAVLRAGNCELALHRAGPAFRGGTASASNVNSNAKLVLSVDGDLASLRQDLIAKGVSMGQIKSFPPLTGPLCDGRDPEGNVFQLAAVDW